MSRWHKARAWINRDDGSYWRVDNRNLGPLSITGYFMVIVALIILTLHDKGNWGEPWIGWLVLVTGLICTYIGEKGKTLK